MALKGRLIGRSKQPTIHLPSIPETAHKATTTPESKVLTSAESLVKLEETAKRKEVKAKKEQEQKEDREARAGSAGRESKNSVKEPGRARRKCVTSN